MPAPSRAAETTGATRRLAWIDMARGFCVMAVVLLHVGIFHAFPLAPDAHGRPLARVWELLNTSILADLRMPLLLLLSGHLARTKVRAGLGYARTRLAIATNLHLYVVWTVVFFALGVLFFPNLGETPYQGRSWEGFAHSLGYPQTGPLWFVYVLFFSVTVLAASRRLPAPLVLAGFFALGWGVMAVTQDAAGLPRAVFFAAGALFGEHVVALTDSRRATTAALLGYVMFTGLGELVDPVPAYPLSVAAGLCAAVAFLALAKLVARVRLLREPGAWVGRRTLGIYVLHWPLVALLTWIGMTRPEWFTGWLRVQVLEVLYPIAAAALVIVISMGCEQLLKTVGLGVLFDLPRPVKARLTRTAHTEARPAVRPRGVAPRTSHEALPEGVRLGEYTSPVPEAARERVDSLR